MLAADNCVLAVIDVQGRLARVVFESTQATSQISKLVQGVLLLEVPIIVTAQVPEKIGNTIPEIVSLLPGMTEIPRTHFSIFGESEIREKLAMLERKQILLCGFEAHICLYQSAMELKEAGYEVYLVADATSSREQINKSVALAELSQNGIHLTTVEMAFFSMLKSCDHPNFKLISNLIK